MESLSQRAFNNNMVIMILFRGSVAAVLGGFSTINRVASFKPGDTGGI